MMTFEIIKNSESHTGYEIEDKVFRGLISGLVCGWQFEFTNDAGEFTYNDVAFEGCMPEEYAYQFEDGGLPWIAVTPSWSGWRLTGRVVFRGYAEEYYDVDVHDWCVKEVEVK